MLVALACALAVGRASGQPPEAVARGQRLSGQITYAGEVPLETTPDGPLSDDHPVHISDTPPAALTISLTLPPRS